MRQMFVLLIVFALGIGAADASATTIQSSAPFGVLVAADSGPNGDNGGVATAPSPNQESGSATTISPGSAQQGADLSDWPKMMPIATSKGGSAKGFGSRGGGRHNGGAGGGHGRGGGRSRGSSRAGGHSSSGHGVSKHSSGKGKGRAR